MKTDVISVRASSAVISWPMQEGHRRAEGQSQHSNITSRPPAVRTHVTLVKVNERADTIFVMSSLLCSFLLTENRKCRRWLNRCDTPKQIESSTGRVCVYKMKGSFNNAPCNHTDTDKLIITIKAPGTGSIKYHCECVCVSRRMRCISSSGIRLAVPKWNPRILMYYITEHAGLRDGTFLPRIQRSSHSSVRKKIWRMCSPLWHRTLYLD